MPKTPASKPSFVSTQIRSGRYLFLDLPRNRSGPLTIVCAGREICDADFLVERDTFDYFALEFVISGRWRLSGPDGTEVLEPGAVFCYGPGIAHTIELLEGNEPTKCFLDFTGRNARALLRESGLDYGKALYPRSSGWLEGLFEQLLDCSDMEPESAKVIGRRLTELILIRLKEDSQGSFSRSTDPERTYLRCRTFIQEHFIDLHSVAEVAAECDIDPAYLSKLFRRHSGEAPLRYLTRLKTARAAELMIRRNYNVRQAGKAVGYDDPYHFSRVFKRVHGISPAGFRSLRESRSRSAADPG
ncbi:helix-turn-helix transcriptional regulator [Haloferula helveola]